MEINSDEDDLYLSEIENKIDIIELIICATGSRIRDKIDEKILRVYKKVMYYIYDDKGCNCSPYIFYFGMSTQGKVRSEINYISENCKAITMIYDNSKHSEEELESFKEELKYYNIQYGNIYKVLDEDSDFTDFIRIVTYSISINECILNFLDDYNTENIIKVFNNYSSLTSDMKLISLSLKFNAFKFPSSNVDHIIINYFNPINPLPIYNNILESIENLYGIKLQLQQYIYNTVNAVSFWKLIMKKTKSKFHSTNGFLLAHYKQIFNNGKYDFKIQENHHMSHSRHVIYQKYKDNKPKVIFESVGTYETYVYSIDDSKMCLLIDDVFNEYYTPKRLVTIGFVIPSSTNSYQNIYPNIVTGLVSYFVMTEKIYKLIGREDVRFKYVIYRVNDDNENECIKAIQNSIDEEVDFIVAPVISSCVESMVNYLNKSSIIIFATDYLMGTTCNSKFVYTSKVPNQIINPTFGYFTEFLASTKYCHLIYNHNKVSREILDEIIAYSISQQGNGYSVYKFTKVSAETYSILLNIFKHPGLIMTFLDSVDLGYFLSELSHYSLDKNKWKIFSLLVNHESLIYNIPSKYLDNVYISSLVVDESKSKPILDYYFLTDHQPIYSGSTEVAFEFIYEMIIHNETLKDLYGKVFHNEIVGDFQLDESNSIRYPLLLAYYNNGVREIVFPSSYLFKPNPLLFSLKQEQCDFSISNEITPVKIQKVHLGLVYQKQSDLIISSLLAQVLNFMAFNIKQGVQYFAGIVYLTTDIEIRDFIQQYIDDDSLNPCILLTHPQFKTEILDLIRKTDKMFYITNFRNEYCLKNLIATEANTLFSLNKVIQLIPYAIYEVDYYLFYDAKLKDLYDQINALLAENGYKAIFSRSIEDYDEDVLLDNLEFSDRSAVVFCDSSDEICEMINNLMQSELGDGVVFFIQWFYESPTYVDSLYHLMYGSAYPSDTEFTSYTTLKYYTEKNNKSSLFDYYSLNKIYDLLKVIYMWMEIEKLDDSKEFSELYLKEIETEVGPIKLNPNNRISSHMILYFHYIDMLLEFKLSNFVELRQFDKDFAEKDTALHCNWKDGNGLKEKKKMVVAIIHEKKYYESKTSSLYVMLRVLKESQYYEEGLFEKYSIEASIKFCMKWKPNCMQNILDELFSKDFLIAIFDFTTNSLEDYQEMIDSKNVLYFDLGYLINSYCSDRIFEIGLSVVSLVRYTLLDCIETIKIAIIIHSKDEFGYSYINAFEEETKGFMIKMIPMAVSDLFDIIELFPICLKIPNQCVIISTAYIENLSLLFLLLSASKISLENDILFYYYFYSDTINQDFSNSFTGAKYISSFNPSVNFYDYKGNDPMIYDFKEYIKESFCGVVEATPSLEGVIVGYEILKKLLLSSEDVNFDLVLSKAHNLYFDTPAGPVYFGTSSFLMIDVMFSKITNQYKIEYQDSRKAVNPIYWNNTCSTLIKPIIVGVIFDFSNTSYLSSQVYFSLVKELIVNQNRIGGINDRQIVPILYPLYHNENDTVTIEDLVSNENISIILGCVTHYCNYKILPYLSSSDKLLFSHLFYPVSYGQPNVITIGLSVERRLKTAKTYLDSTTFKAYVLIYHTSLNDPDDISYFKENGISFEKVFQITHDNYTEDIDKALNYLEIETNKREIALFNLLGESLLLQFEESFIQRTIKNNNFIQIIFNLNEYLLGFDLLSKISGSIVVTTFTENSNSHLATLFEEMIKTRFGSIRITQGMALFDVSIKMLVATYRQAEKLLTEDGIVYDEMNEDYIFPFEYLRRAAQMSSFECSCGTVAVTTSNEVIYGYEVGYISPNGNIISVKTDVREFILPNRNSKDCYFGPKIRIYELPVTVTIPTIVITALILIMSAVVFVVVIKYRKKLKACSPFFICFYIISACISILLEVLYNKINDSEIGCEIVVVLLFISIINCVSVIVFKTWRIHAIYNNVGIKKTKITDMIVLSKISYILIPDALICVVFGLFNTLGSIQSNKSIEMSTTIEYVIFQKCQINIYFLVFQIVMFLLIASLGLYYSWGTRKTSKEYNDSQAMAISLGLLTFLIVVTVILETSLDFELDIKYIFEIIGSSAVLFVVLMVLFVPKFYLIVIKKKVLTISTEESIKKSVKADIQPQIVDGAFLVDYSKVTRTYGTKTVIYPQHTTMNTRLGAMIPGAYARKKALEVVKSYDHDDFDGEGEVKRSSDDSDSEENEGKK